MADDRPPFARPTSEDLLRTYTQEDMMGSGIRLALSACGPVGAVVSEFLTQFVPGQRIDRLQQFVEELHERLSGMEDRFKAKLQESAGYAVLSEQVSVAAVQTADAQKRRDFAEMLKTGLTKSETELVEYDTLLRLRQQVNEPQILMLMDKANFSGLLNDPEREAFRAKHGPQEEIHRRWAISSHYAYELISLGLLRDTEGIAKSSIHRNTEITPLGGMLLDAIGRRTRPAGTV